MDGKDFGYREIEHTADWMLEVWAPDLPALLEQAARGMYALSGVKLALGDRRNITLELDFLDPESLLVRFLGELLYYADQESLGFDGFQIQVEGTHMDALLSGSTIISRDKEIKAVTYHYLEIRSTDQGLEARVVFDV
jgi:SHS2 domain-containing protein